MAVFLDPTNDIAFRRIFGNEKKKSILISFLNNVLELPQDRLIQDLDYLDRTQTPDVFGKKESILDVQCRDLRGVTYIVEMQLIKRTGFEERVVYYSAKSYSSQIVKGEDYPTLNQVIFLGILDFKIFDGASYLSNHLILDTHTLVNHFRALRFCFIELPKFKLTENQLNTVVEKWIYFLQTASESDKIPSIIVEKEIIDAYHELEKYSWTEDELDAYIRAGILLQDKRGEIENAVLEGKKETASNAIEMGFDNATISKLTNLSEEQIEQLRKRTNN